MKERDDNIALLDVFKLLFAIEIVAGHARYEFHNILIKNIVTFMEGAGLPFFFMVSGYLLFSRKINSNSIDDMTNKVITATKGMCRRYIVWSIMGLPLAIYEFVYWKTGLFIGVIIYLRDAIFRGEHYSGAPTWYIVSSIYSLLIIYIILKMTKNEKIIFLMIPISLIVYYLILYLLRVCKEDSIFLFLISNTIGIFNGRIIMGCWAIPAGILIAKVSHKIKPIYSWIALPFTMIMREFIGHGRICDLIFAFNLIMCILTINLCGNHFSLCIRRISTVMYFSHMFFISAVLFLNDGVYDDGVFYISIFLSIVVGILVHIFIQKDVNKEFWKLFI